MEKLFIRIVFILFCVVSTAQDKLCVYKTQGASIIEKNNKQMAIKKGTIIDKMSVVKLFPDSEIIAIDNTGNTYMIKKAGDFSLKHLLNFKTKKNSSSFTASYFKHIWNEMTAENNEKVLIAGVFRGEVLMTYPHDKSKVANSKIVFKWHELVNTELYYVFVKNPITDDILKIETNGTHLALYDDNAIFQDSYSFDWTVSTEAFPNLDNIPFHNFNIIDRNEYMKLKENYSEFIDDLQSLGLTDSIIEDLLCKLHGLCK